MRGSERRVAGGRERVGLQAWLLQKKEEWCQLTSGRARTVQLGVRDTHISASSSPVLVSAEGTRGMPCMGEEASTCSGREESGKSLASTPQQLLSGPPRRLHGVRALPARQIWTDCRLSGTFRPSASSLCSSSLRSGARSKQALRQEMFLNVSSGFGVQPFSCQGSFEQRGMF
ncbi:uncharacterized protein A230072I06Rik [Mus musculus]|jgi:hypothetical protein|uniref:Uncharacterized protein n=1 Tax=Mus musculus TaxID=10090 RepID=Q3UUJ8_MOUSE|nr:uncharacterized protein A230072I06Rik [Mus musculus]BAE23627.1 unnamed protein product [Mus musculus]